jgi:L-iditol 2-dehydrogenase
MKALLLEEYNKLIYTDVPKPEPAAGEVLVRVKACGICGSDVHGMDGSSGRRIPPLVMGHEASGLIEDVGEEVHDWQPGDRVTFDSTVFPLDDWFTINGMYNLSDKREVLGVSPGEYRRHGAFAEFVVVPQHILYRLPDNVSFEQAAMVEPIAVALHALSLTPLQLGDTVLLVGAGMIGLFLVQVLRHSNAGNIIVTDLDEERLKLARQFGASDTLPANEGNLVQHIRTISGGRGADVAFEAVGISDTVQLAVEAVRKGGAVTLIGNLSKTVNFPLQSVVTRQIRLQGSCAIRGEYDVALRMLSEGKIDVSPLLSVVAPLSEGAGWFDQLYRKTPGLNKVILTP